MFFPMFIIQGEMMNLKNMYDMHFHSNPSIIDRLVNDETLVKQSIKQSMKGVMLKSHHESTITRANLLNEKYFNFEVYGGIVLNYFVGGLNPFAVESSLNFGAKQIWMPTIHAKNHVDVHGTLGSYDVQESKSRNFGNKQGISILKNGKVKDNVIEILKLISEYDVILGTSHLSKEEIFKLVKKANEYNVKKILITHPYFKVPNLTLDDLEELISYNAIAEFGYCTISPMWSYTSFEKVYKSIKKLGAKNCVIVSDTGQKHNPTPPEGLRIMAQSLYEKGLSCSEIEIITKQNPFNLLH